MGVCPFCNVEVNEELLLYGGSCPHCLLEIPGEEAPTDPGENGTVDPPEVVAHAAKKKQRTSLIVAALVGLLGAVGVAAYLSQPPVEEYAEMPEISINRDLSGHINLPVEDDPGDNGTTLGNNDVTNRNGSGTASGTPSVTRPPVGGQVTASATETPREAKPAGLDDLIGMSAGVDPNAGLPGAQVLTSDSEIQEMVSRNIGFKLPQIEGCYNTRLKEQEDLAGTWQASWKITKAGATTGVSVRGRGVSDSTLESCIKAKIQKWSFQKINRDYPVTIPFKLGV
ncbi:MAG: hypothetical protein ACI8RZ_003170 [Myxococcota bacterium]|jgi:hypothetical protein